MPARMTVARSLALTMAIYFVNLAGRREDEQAIVCLADIWIVRQLLGCTLDRRNPAWMIRRFRLRLFDHLL